MRPISSRVATPLPLSLAEGAGASGSSQLVGELRLLMLSQCAPMMMVASAFCPSRRAMTFQQGTVPSVSCTMVNCSRPTSQP